MADTADATDANAAPVEQRGLILDEQQAAFNAFRNRDDGKADKILQELGGNDPVGRDIVLKLAGK